MEILTAAATAATVATMDAEALMNKKIKQNMDSYRYYYSLHNREGGRKPLPPYSGRSLSIVVKHSYQT